jgi:hypothetical protein
MSEPSTDAASNDSGGTNRRTVLESVPAALLGAGLVGLGGGAGVAGAQQLDAGDGSGAVDLEVIERLRSGPVAANGRDELRLTPDGPAMTIIGMQLRADSVIPATAGTHSFSVAQEAGDEPMPLIEGTATHDEQLHFHGQFWRSADRGATPSDETATLLTLQGTPITDQRGLVVSYDNETNATQAQMRTVRVFGATHRSE